MFFIGIQRQLYPLQKDIYLGLVDDPEKVELLSPFLHFGFSTEGQDILKDLGYRPIDEWEKMTIHTKMKCENGLHLHDIAKYCGPEDSTLKIGGSDAMLPVAKVWSEMYKLGCSIDIERQGGGSTNGAYRVCGDFEYGTRVDLVSKISSW
jgi:ABC-type phosphate transport system substrate-binding protein